MRNSPNTNKRLRDASGPVDSTANGRAAVAYLDRPLRCGTGSAGNRAFSTESEPNSRRIQMRFRTVSSPIQTVSNPAPRQILSFSGFTSAREKTARACGGRRGFHHRSAVGRVVAVGSRQRADYGYSAYRENFADEGDADRGLASCDSLGNVAATRAAHEFRLKRLRNSHAREQLRQINRSGAADSDIRH